ncbi:MAG TPA: DUF5718 family protein [Solirubrobacteraceae bacterium]|nr:DUF5718 family protein [Solirubrobacteraceae bacterium]
MIDLPTAELTDVVGFGVAGNFAGHLEQAGEAADFVHVEARAEAPKGIFPWYVPGASAEVPAFLHAFPLSAEQIVIPAGADHLQIEPEVGLLARVRYADGGRVQALEPEAVTAFNDCSIRRPGARKISEKKNWGAHSKGVAARAFPVIDLSVQGPTASFRLTCFLLRDGALHAYGVDSAVTDYSYYADTLLEWIAERLTHQQGTPDTPLEDVGAYLRAAGSPARVLIGIGATRYTELGERTYLQPGDESIVAVYDSATHSASELADALMHGVEGELAAASVLRQRVRAT